MEKNIYVNGKFIDRISDSDLDIIEKCFGGKIVNIKEINLFGDLALNIFIEK